MRKMDYTMGFQSGGAGQKWTAKALTDRAKERTPEPRDVRGPSRGIDIPEELAG